MYTIFLCHCISEKKAGNQPAQSPPTDRPAPEGSIQTDVVTVEESESDIAETEFTIPEKNEQEVHEKPSGKYYGPSFMTFKL